MSGAMNQEHHPELVDDVWCWVSDVANPEVEGTSYAPTGTVHLEGCPHLNSTAYLRPVRDDDVIWHRCEHCVRRADEAHAEQIAENRRAEALRKARDADPELQARVRARLEERRLERGF